MAEQARKVVETNGMTDTIEVIHAKLEVLKKKRQDIFFSHDIKSGQNPFSTLYMVLLRRN